MADGGTSRLLAYNIYTCRKRDMNQASHHAHVSQVNTPIITPLLRKYGAVSYAVCSDESHNYSPVELELKRLLGESIDDGEHVARNPKQAMGERPSITRSDFLLEFDTIISIVVPGIEWIDKMRNDPVFLEKYMPDHYNFADMSCTRYVKVQQDY